MFPLLCFLPYQNTDGMDPGGRTPYAFGNRDKRQRNQSYGQTDVRIRAILSPQGEKDDLKCVDNFNATFENYTIALLPYVSAPWNLPRTGVSFNNRVGSRIQNQMVHIKMTLVPTGVAVGADYCHLALVYDRQYNAGSSGFSPPVGSDIFQSVDSAGTTASNVFSDINYSNRNRFLILREWRLTLPPTSALFPFIAPTDSAQQDLFTIDEYIDLHGLYTQFTINGNPLLAISTGALLFYSVGTVAAGGFVVHASHRLWFTDV